MHWLRIARTVTDSCGSNPGHGRRLKVAHYRLETSDTFSDKVVEYVGFNKTNSYIHFECTVSAITEDIYGKHECYIRASGGCKCHTHHKEVGAIFVELPFLVHLRIVYKN